MYRFTLTDTDTYMVVAEYEEFIGDFNFDSSGEAVTEAFIPH